METLKSCVFGVITCLVELGVGILLLLNPVAFTGGIIIAIGVCLILSGMVSAVSYFRTAPIEAALRQDLTKGLLSVLLGVFCVCQSDWFILTFPILSVLYGIGILVSGISKVQWTIDLIRLKRNKWFLSAISALLSIVCAIVILNNPFSSAAVLWMFAGITLILEAIFDIVTLILTRKVTGNDVMGDKAAPEIIEGEIVE